jgi:hypothetical protein
LAYITRFTNALRESGYADADVRESIFEWLCETSDSRDDFEDEAEAAADGHDSPEDEDEDEED